MSIGNIKVDEKFRGRSGTTGRDASAEIAYVARSTNKLEDDLDVKRAVLLAAPSVWQDVDGTYMDRIGITDFDEQGGFVWHVRVSYAKNQLGPLESGEGRFAFRTTGATKRVLFSKGTRGRYGVEQATNAPDQFGAIGVTSHGTIEGCEIVIPSYEANESHLVPASRVTDAYKRMLIQLTGQINDANFKGLDRDEALFMGAEGTQQGKNGDWDLNYTWQGSGNTNVVVRGIAGGTGPNGSVPKKGWDYLWVQYQEYADTVAKGPGMKPTGAYVEIVYDEGRFADLAIGI